MVLTGLLVGLLFGFVIHRGGLIRYSRIVGTLLLRDLKAMNFMFFGLAIAAILYGISNIFGMGVNPRVNGFFGTGHIIGGIIFGTGIAISGFCPGSCAARISAGKVTNTSIGIIGMIVGVAVYDIFYPTISKLGGTQKFVTLSDLTGIPYGPLAIAFGLVFIGVAFFADRIDPSKKYDENNMKKPFWKREWGWKLTGAIAGVLIFLATAFGGYISFSSGFLTLTGHTADLVGIKMQSLPNLTDDTLWRALLMLGVFPGAFISARLSDTAKDQRYTPMFDQAIGGKENRLVRGIAAFTGGFMTLLGAQIGGGCTTGAFMSAWPTLSIGNFVMGGTFFVTAIVAAHIVYIREPGLIFKVKQKFDLSLAND